MVRDDELLLDNLYNAFDPFEPLKPGDPVYVDCKEVRGYSDVQVDLGNDIRRSRRLTYQLYAGHRGAGKSTELLRLKQSLEERRFCVVYFAAEEEDINPQDTQYTDILLACTRHLLETLKDSAKPTPVLNWLRDRWEDLKDLAQTQIAFGDMTIGAQISQFAQLSANLRAVPSLRHQIRQKVDPHTLTLLEALNQFIDEAVKHLPNNATKLAVIADNLDRIVPIPQEDGRLNHEAIFIDRSDQLRSLHCHIVYTVPISMVYSRWASELRERYGDPQVLPMIMIQTIEGQRYEPGFQKVKEILAQRVRRAIADVAPDLDLEREIFASPTALEGLCLMSGGHVRNLMLLTQEAINYTDKLPISTEAVQRAISEAGDTYRRTVEADQWEILAKAARNKCIDNEDECRSLLFNRCLLEYRFLDEQSQKQRWHDVHPLILGAPEFKEALKRIQP